jgi:hypothetical protein
MIDESFRARVRVRRLRVGRAICLVVSPGMSDYQADDDHNSDDDCDGDHEQYSPTCETHDVSLRRMAVIRGRPSGRGRYDTPGLDQLVLGQCRLALSVMTRSPSNAPSAALTKLPIGPSPPRRPAMKL